MTRTRVRVAQDNVFRLYAWHCPACDLSSVNVWATLPRTVASATDHARTCPALRLALLLERLERLRDGWYIAAAKYTSDAERDGISALAFREYTCRAGERVKSARDLTAVIAEATR